MPDSSDVQPELYTTVHMRLAQLAVVTGRPPDACVPAMIVKIEDGEEERREHMVHVVVMHQDGRRRQVFSGIPYVSFADDNPHATWHFKSEHEDTER